MTRYPNAGLISYEEAQQWQQLEYVPMSPSPTTLCIVLDTQGYGRTSSLAISQHVDEARVLKSSRLGAL